MRTEGSGVRRGFGPSSSASVPTDEAEQETTAVNGVCKSGFRKRFGGQVQLENQFQQVDRFDHRSISHLEVVSEAPRAPKRISFGNIQLYRKRRSLQLVKDRARRRRPILGPRGRHGYHDFVRMLPGKQRFVIPHSST